MTRSRRTFTAQERAAVVKRYLVDKVPVSDLCDELGLQRTQIYQWQKQLFENADAAFGPDYPQSNGKIERYHRTIKGDCIRDKHIETVESARRIVAEYVRYYNEIRLHSGIGYVTPETKLLGKEREVFAERDQKLEAACEARRLRRGQQAA